MKHINVTRVIALLLGGTLGLACHASSVSQTTTSPSLSPEVSTLPKEAVTMKAIASGLRHPWGMAWLPNGDVLITERPGQLRIIRDGQLDPTPVPGLATVSTVAAQQLFASQQGGLLDVAVHPRFSENRWVYFSYAHGTAEANRTRVARARFDGSRLEDWEVVFEVGRTKTGGQHFGSRLVWLPDETLLISIGDGGNPPVQLDGDVIRKQAQNLGTHFGKVVRIRDDGSIPADNPFRETAGAEPEVWSYGHRNIQGMAFDPGWGRLWATEHGSRGGDELNWVESGENYGWPIVSFSQEYTSRKPVAPVTSAPDKIDPRRVWTPSIAPSGLAIYTGDRFPQWQGNLFAGGLVSRDVRRLEVDATGAVISESVIEIGDRVRDVRQGPDGYLYVLTDTSEGKLLRLEPAN